MQKLPSLSIFFPAYNEEANVQKSIEKALEVAAKVTNDYEVIVVNDGSKDRTGAVVAQMAASNSSVKLINHEVNQGYGGALLTGFRSATKEWVFFSDSDLQFDLDELTLLVDNFDKSDVILGYRIKRNDPFLRFLNAKGWNLLNRLFFGLQVKDIDCAFKLIKTETLKAILPVMISQGAMISAELLIRLMRAGNKFVEVGVHHYPRKAGSPTGAKPAVIIRAFKEMWKVWRTGI